MTEQLNTITGQIIGAAMKVHTQLGPGLLESAYQKCMGIELQNRGLRVAVEVPVPVIFDGDIVDDNGFRIDLLVQDEIVVELKSVQQVLDIHKKQLLTYLRLASKPLGLLINFNEMMLKDGVTRIANGPFEE